MKKEINLICRIIGHRFINSIENNFNKAGKTRIIDIKYPMCKRCGKVIKND